jgi:glycosyltransferase involved in cell wall biosynthesis
MENNKILIISRNLCYPAHKSGVSSSIFNLLKKASIDYDIDYIYLEEKDTSNENFLQKELDITIFNINILGKQFFSKINSKYFFKNRASLSINVNKFPIPDCESYKYVILTELSVALLLDRFQNINNSKVLFFEADSNSMFYQRSYKNSRNPLYKFYYFTQYLIVRHIENILYNSVHRTIFVSNIDKIYTIKNFKINDPNRIININLGVDNLEVYKTLYNVNSEISLSFSGILDYPPNKDAVDYIVYTILPKLEELKFNFKMHIVGKNPSKEWTLTKFYKNGSLIITGFVDNIYSYLCNTDIYISPLFLGSGMKNKILQAMSVGLPIICSKVSAEGINELIDGQNILIVDKNVDSWVNSILKLSKDLSLMQNFGKESRKIIMNYYSWDNFYSEFFGFN